MTVYFSNSGLIDLDTIRIMGVSVKDTDSPIGYFGTGLKFAVATLLRTGHSVTIWRGGEKYVMSARQTEIRGKTFERIYMNDEALSFTTELGKNWLVWQAYRELHSNMLDECGEVGTKRPTADTVVAVTGEEFQQCYRDRGTIFLQSEPFASSDAVEVHQGSTRHIYYRGVRAGTLPSESAFTYNILRETALSEDRNIRSMWDVEYCLETNLPRIESEDLALGLVRGTTTWDQNLNFSMCSAPSDKFMGVARRFRDDANVSDSVRRIVESGDQRDGSFPAVDLTTDEADKLREAFSILEILKSDLDAYEVDVVETLGSSIMGLYHVKRDQIFLAREALDRGPDFAAMVLYEEWLHKRHKLDDCSRQMQSYLLAKLVSFAKGEFHDG